MSETTKEKIYDEQLRPLLLKVHEIAQANNIGYIAYFELDGDPSATHLTSSSANIAPAVDPSGTLIRIAMLLQEAWGASEGEGKGWKN